MPLTALTILISTIATALSWMFVTKRLRDNPKAQTYQTRLMAGSFFYSMLYGIFMLLPVVLIWVHADSFPLVMAIGFVIGHAFLYLSFLQMIRLTFSLVPSMNGKAGLAVSIGVLAILILTANTALHMIWGTHPEYNQASGIIDFHTTAVINLGDAAFGIFGAVPAGILMIINGFINRRTRVRSFLIGGGIVMLMITGPFVEGAKQATPALIANSFSVIGLLILTLGVAHRIDQKLTLAPAKSRR